MMYLWQDYAVKSTSSMDNWDDHDRAAEREYETQIQSLCLLQGPYLT